MQRYYIRTFGVGPRGLLCGHPQDTEAERPPLALGNTALEGSSRPWTWRPASRMTSDKVCLHLSLSFPLVNAGVDPTESWSSSQP